MLDDIGTLLDKLRAQLDGIKTSIEEYKRFDREARATENDTRKDIPARISELRVSENEKIAAENHRKKAQQQQVILTWMTGGAFVAAAIYAGIAALQLRTSNRQLVSMDKTYCQLSRQTALLSSQLKGTEAAVVEVSVGIGNLIGDYQTPFNGFQIVIRNNGRVVANNVKANVEITRLSVGGKMLEKRSFPYSIPVLDFHPGSSEFVQRVIFEDSETGTRVLTAAQNLEQTVKVETTYVYDDGFGDTITGAPQCKEFLYPNWVACQSFPAELNDAKAKNQKK